jgi:hypothetical protein
VNRERVNGCADALNLDHIHADWPPSHCTQAVRVYDIVNAHTVHTARQQQRMAFVPGSGCVRMSGSVSLRAWALLSRLRPSLFSCTLAGPVILVVQSPVTVVVIDAMHTVIHVRINVLINDINIGLYPVSSRNVWIVVNVGAARTVP